MRLAPIHIAALSLSLLAGCDAYPRLHYAEFRGPADFPGKGGAVTRIADFDIWTVGEPDRPYRLLGIIETTRRGSRTLVEQLTEDGDQSPLLRLAREKGAHALILIDAHSAVTGYTTDIDTFGGHHHDRLHTRFGYVRTTAETETTTRVSVVQYLGAPPAVSPSAPSPANPTP